MWLTVLRSAGPYALSVALGFGAAWYWQALRIDSIRADLLVLQAQVSAANESARIANEAAAARAATAQGKIDAISAELAKALARPARTVDVVRRVSVRLPCPDSQDRGTPPDKNTPPLVSPADPRVGASEYRCFRLDSFAQWRDSITAERDRLRDGHLAHQALSRAIEAAPDHIEITD